MNIFDTIVIGGGASGLVASSELKGNTLLIESSDRVGKKILATGNGRCNLSNQNLSGEFYSNPHFFDTIFSANRTIVSDYFTKLGLLVKPDKAGRLYPYTMQASTVLDILRYSLDCSVRLSERVQDIVLDKGLYTVTTDKGSYQAKFVILCTGGGKVHTRLVKSTTFSPSLCPIKTDTTRIKGLDGIKVQCGLGLLKDGKIIYSECGEVLFRNYGVSGVAVFNASSFIARDRVKGDFSKYQISLNFLQDTDIVVVRDIIARRIKSKVDREKLLLGIVPNKVGLCLLSNIINFSVESIVGALSDYRLVVKDLQGDIAQVTAGGVRLDDIDEHFESRQNRGLFVVGEALDMDGLCGGYNLHWAFMSGLVASKVINSKL